MKVKKLHRHANKWGILAAGFPFFSIPRNAKNPNQSAPVGVSPCCSGGDNL